MTAEDDSDARLYLDDLDDLDVGRRIRSLAPCCTPLNNLLTWKSMGD
jgi:hypothetical protein